jgi:hypothetical protein
MQVDLSALGRSAGAKGTLHVLEGRLNNTPTGSETLAPGQIREEQIDIAGDRDEVTVRLPRRSVTVVEIPLLRTRPRS